MSKALRKPVSKNPKKKDTSPLITPTIFIGFALLCFITSFVMNTSTSMNLKGDVSASGGTFGPIKVKKNNSVFEITASQPLVYGTSNYLTVELLDSNKTYLFSFGKEFWAENGWDSDGSWSESDTEVSSKFTIKKKGVYYLRFKSDTGTKPVSQFRDIKVKISKKRGSSLPHLVAGIFGLIIGFVLYYVKQNSGGSYND